MQKSDLKLSVALTTYNHEKFIADSLDSILAQKVNFKYEIVIGEDKSTDNTLKIIEEYKAKHPEIIRILPRNKNLGYTKNFDDTMQKCLGEYISIFDGDDIMYQGKLQKQVDFLNQNPDFGMVGHIARQFESDSNETIQHLKPKEKKDFYTIEDLIIWGSFLANSTKMFRKSHYPKQGIDSKIKSIADLAVTIDIVGKNKIGFLWETLCDYRFHSTSIMNNLKGKVDFEDRMLILDNLRKNYHNEYNHLFYNQLAYSYMVKGIEEFNNGERNLARKSFIISIKNNYRYSLTSYYYLLISFLPQNLHKFIWRMVKG